MYTYSCSYRNDQGRVFAVARILIHAANYIYTINSYDMT